MSALARRRADSLHKFCEGLFFKLLRHAMTSERGNTVIKISLRKSIQGFITVWHFIYFNTIRILRVFKKIQVCFESDPKSILTLFTVLPLSSVIASLSYFSHSEENKILQNLCAVDPAVLGQTLNVFEYDDQAKAQMYSVSETYWYDRNRHGADIHDLL